MPANEYETPDHLRQVPYDTSVQPAAPKLPDQIHIHVHVATGYPAAVAQPTSPDVASLIRVASAATPVRRARPLVRWGGTALAVAAAFFVGQYAAGPNLPTMAAIATPAPTALVQSAPGSSAATAPTPRPVGRAAVDLPEFPAAASGQPAAATIGGNLAGPPPLALLQQFAQPSRVEPPRAAPPVLPPGPAPAGPRRDAFGLER